MFKCIFKQDNEYKCLFDGKWIESESGNKLDILSPVTGELVGSVQSMSKKEVDLFVENAKISQKEWQNVPVYKRADIIHKAADILEGEKEIVADIVVAEIAKNKKSALSEISRTVDFMHFTAEEGKRVVGESMSSDLFPGFGKNKISIVTREPLGLVLAIAPFNYPVNLSASKLAPALVAGNTVLFKPPTQGSISALYLAQVFCKAGIPAGVLNVITGRGKDIGDYLISHPGIDMINFTGSSKVGKGIGKKSGMIPLLLELGGKDAAIVLPDADFEETSKNIVSGAFSYSGQRCTAVKRILVLDKIADKLIEILLPKIKSLSVGLPEDNAEITCLINDKAADFVEELVSDALDKGAKALLDFKREKNLIYPMLLDNVNRDMRIAWEEPFGPVLPIIRVKSIDEAIAISNESEYGLQGCVFTKDIDTAFNIASKLEVGTVQINGKTERGPDHFPFIGVKSSGLGTQGVKYSIESMTRAKAVVLNIK